LSSEQVSTCSTKLQCCKSYEQEEKSLVTTSRYIDSKVLSVLLRKFTSSFIVIDLHMRINSDPKQHIVVPDILAW